MPFCGHGTPAVPDSIVLACLPRHPEPFIERELYCLMGDWPDVQHRCGAALRASAKVKSLMHCENICSTRTFFCSLLLYIIYKKQTTGFGGSTPGSAGSTPALGGPTVQHPSHNGASHWSRQDGDNVVRQDA